MQAFASYAEQVSIDFTKTEQNLFLIAGDTGAGKTTIFDALVFALYGEASSNANKKEGAILQSQFAGIEKEPFVELVFLENDNRYSIRRVPRHQKPITRGARKGRSTREVSGSVSLILPDGTEYPPKETDQKIVELIGLTKSQFMQVAMIAQGEFMQLLRSSSNEKKEIFRHLFGTELYQDITKALDDRKKEKEKEIGQVRIFAQAETSHLRIPEDYPEIQKLQEEKQRIQEGDLSSLSEFMEEAKSFYSWSEKKRKEAEDLWANAREVWEKKKKEFQTGEELIKEYQAVEEALRRLSAYKTKEEQMTKERLLTGKIRKAFDVLAEYRLYAESGKRMVDMQKEEQDLIAALPRLQKELEEAEADEEKQKTAYEWELSSFSEIRTKVQKELKNFAELEEEQKREAGLRRKLEKAKTEAQKAHQGLSDLEEMERKALQEKDRLQDAGQEESRLLSAQKEYARASEEEQKLHQKIGDIRRLSSEQKDKQEAYTDAREKYEKSAGDYQRIRRIFMDGQAGMLAGELKEGEPCPVCGSIHHPHPREQTLEEKEISRADLEARYQRMQKEGKKQEEASGHLREAKAILQAEQKAALETYARVRKLLGSLREDTDTEMLHEDPFNGESKNSKEISERGFPLEKIEEAERTFGEILKKRERNLQEQEEKIQENKKRRSDLQQLLEGMKEKKEKQKRRMETADEKLLEEQTYLAAAGATLRHLREALFYESADEAGKALSLAEENFQRRQKLYASARKVRTKKLEESREAGALLEHLKEELPEQKRIFEKRKIRYHERMKAYNFQEKEWKALAKEYTLQSADEMQARLGAFDQEKAAVLSRIQIGRDKIGNRSKPKPEELEEQERQAARQYEAAEKNFYALEELQKNNQSAVKALERKAASRAKLIEEHARLAYLYRRVSGNESGSRMDLETYVQRLFLEQILEAANRRFEEMSAGQYELRMVRDTDAGAGKNRGLDLMVYSTVTGKEREIRTLSGGESFLAVLALALGLADRIREDSAAINLDMMFIDEGFGTLDEHSRNQAVRVLKEMAGGNRLIGLISHVSELKNEIDDQLLVTKDEKGSHARWA